MATDFKFDVFLSHSAVDKAVIRNPLDKGRRFIPLYFDEAQYAQDHQ